MTDPIGTYGVSADDVSAELPALFKDGFTQATKPSLAVVEGWITDSDTFIDTVVTDVSTLRPDVTDAASRLAKRYVINDVKDRVYEAIAGARMSPTDLAEMRRNSPASTILTQIRALPEASINAQLEAQKLESAVQVPYTDAPRDLVIDTIDLDPNSGFRGRF